MSRWPAVRTDAARAKGYFGVVLLKSAMSMIAMALLLSFAVFLIGALIGLVPGALGWGDSIMGFGYLLFVSPVISVPALALGLPMAGAALLIGRSGWMIALIGGAVAGTAVFFLVEDFALDAGSVAFGSMFGALYAGMFWLSGKIFYPDIFAGPLR